MLIKGFLAKLMVQVDPHLYNKYIIHDKKNQPLLYIKLTKAIYSLLKSALLFNRKFINELKSYSSPFVINPYDPFVAHATVSNKQMMVTWHVDDLKGPHTDPFQVTKYATNLATMYSNGLVLHCGPVHDYLGMDLNFSQPGIAQISMIKYMTKVIDNFPKKITTKCATPAADHLFTVGNEQDANSSPSNKPKPSITLSCNFYSSANAHNTTSTWPSPSSPPA
jgi:hypothetical protein